MALKKRIREWNEDRLTTLAAAGNRGRVKNVRGKENVRAFPKRGRKNKERGDISEIRGRQGSGKKPLQKNKNAGRGFGVGGLKKYEWSQWG